MRHEDYPALFLDADASSNAYQNSFLRLVKGEYAVLLAASVFSLPFLQGALFHLIYAALFFVGLFLLIVRALSKPEQWWYRCRALAESVKTLTWRYMMQATPFEGPDALARSRFRNELHQVFQENIETAKAVTSDWSGYNQITAAMEEVRSLKLADRKKYYLKHRVDEQRKWYSRRATDNRKSARQWIWISAVAYVFAGGMVLTRIVLPEWQYWPIEPLIVVAASIIGWMQIKKFNELAAAYTVAAHEIGLIKPRSDGIAKEDQFSEFVNDSEMAFSREHTLWIARQSD